MLTPDKKMKKIIKAHSNAHAANWRRVNVNQKIRFHSLVTLDTDGDVNAPLHNTIAIVERSEARRIQYQVDILQLLL